MITGVSQMSQMLAEMDRMKGLGRPLSGSPVLEPGGGTLAGNRATTTDFSQVFKGAVSQVNQLQQSANALEHAFEMGDSKVDLTQVMVTMQKANVAFEGMTQVRNKFINAYKEIMNMSV